MTVKVSDAWLAPTEDGRTARVYMDVVTFENATLTYAFTREAKKVELRETRIVDGQAKISTPPGSRLGQLSRASLLRTAIIYSSPASSSRLSKAQH
jgi:hypothetical protein